MSAQQMQLVTPEQTHARPSEEPCVLIGAGCRFPGDINSADELWQALCEKRDGTRPLPRHRVPPNGFVPEPSRAGWLEEVNAE